MASGRQHHYAVTVEWTGNKGTGTSHYKAYERSYAIKAGEKPPIAGSADPAFRGDPARWNPEDLLVASLSACHKLWYLHLCAVGGIVVQSYVDQAEGVMAEDESGSGRFASVVLRPQIIIAAGGDVEKAKALHHQAHHNCFIANSVNFPVSVEPEISIA